MSSAITSDNHNDPYSSFFTKCATKMSELGAIGLAQIAGKYATLGDDMKCKYCGSMFVPGESSRHRIVPSNRRRRKSSLMSGSKNSFMIMCKLCSKVTCLNGSDPKKRKRKALTLAQEPEAKNETHNINGFISLNQPKRRRKTHTAEKNSFPPTSNSSIFSRFMSPK